MRPTYRQLNRHFTAAVFAAPAVAGSAVSFLYNGGALWALFAVLRGRVRLARGRHLRATVAALYLYSLAMVLAALVNGSLAASLPKLAGLASLLLFPFAYSSWRISDKTEIARACMAGSAVACYGALLLALAQVHLLSVWRAWGAAGNELVFANVIVLAGGVSLLGLLRARGRQRLFFLGACLAALLAVAYSGSRAPFVLIVGYAILAAAAHLHGSRRRVSVRGALAGLVMAAGIAVLAVSSVADRIPAAGRMAELVTELSTLIEGSDYESPSGVRVALWHVGLELWLEKPILGHGAADLPVLLNQRLQDLYGVWRDYGHFHNLFINTLVEGGLAGLLPLLAAIAIPLHAAGRVLLRSANAEERFGASLLVVFFSMFVLMGMTNLVLRHDIMDAVFMIFLAVGLYLAVGTSEAEAAEGSPIPAAVLEG